MSAAPASRRSLAGRRSGSGRRPGRQTRSTFAGWAEPPDHTWRFARRGRHRDTARPGRHRDTARRGRHRDTARGGRHRDTARRGRHRDTARRGGTVIPPGGGGRPDTARRGRPRTARRGGTVTPPGGGGTVTATVPLSSAARSGGCDSAALGGQRQSHGASAGQLRRLPQPCHEDPGYAVGARRAARDRSPGLPSWSLPLPIPVCSSILSPPVASVHEGGVWGT